MRHPDNWLRVLVYDRHPVNYVAGALVHLNGRDGEMYSIHGEGFSRLLGPHLPRFYAELGIDRLVGELTAAHLRLMLRDLRGLAVVTEIGVVTIAGHELKRVVVTLDRAAPASGVNVIKEMFMSDETEEMLLVGLRVSGMGFAFAHGSSNYYIMRRSTFETMQGNVLEDLLTRPKTDPVPPGTTEELLIVELDVIAIGNAGFRHGSHNGYVMPRTTFEVGQKTVIHSLLSKAQVVTPLPG